MFKWANTLYFVWDNFMGSSRQKKKLAKKNEVLSRIPDDPEHVVRLKIGVRKQGARVESVPLKKLERLASRKNLRWKYEDGWLILWGLS